MHSGILGAILGQTLDFMLQPKTKPILWYIESKTNKIEELILYRKICTFCRLSGVLLGVENMF